LFQGVDCFQVLNRASGAHDASHHTWGGEEGLAGEDLKRGGGGKGAQIIRGGGGRGVLKCTGVEEMTGRDEGEAGEDLRREGEEGVRERSVVRRLVKLKGGGSFRSIPGGRARMRRRGEKNEVRWRPRGARRSEGGERRGCQGKRYGYG
jgi:hypothetical protein